VALHAEVPDLDAVSERLGWVSDDLSKVKLDMDEYEKSVMCALTNCRREYEETLLVQLAEMRRGLKMLSAALERSREAADKKKAKA
jgi:hypothetical protein